MASSPLPHSSFAALPRRFHLMRFSPAGFTLVELLVVISMISVLMVLGMSMLAKIREGGKEVVNLSNLKQLTAAHLAYAADHNGRIPETTQYLGPDNQEGLFWTLGINLWSTGGGRRLFQLKKWPFGTGDQDYLATPDLFYGPFSSLINKQRKLGEMEQYAPTCYRIGYIFYYLPDADASTPQRQATLTPDGRLMSNHLLATGHPRAPLLSDPYSNEQADLLGFPKERRKFTCVSHLDGSVDKVRFLGSVSSNAATLLHLAGLSR